MEKERCQVNVTELDQGYRIEITGPDVKEKCDCLKVIERCCDGKSDNAQTCC